MIRWILRVTRALIAATVALGGLIVALAVLLLVAAVVPGIGDDELGDALGAGVGLLLLPGGLLVVGIAATTFWWFQRLDVPPVASVPRLAIAGVLAALAALAVAVVAAACVAAATRGVVGPWPIALVAIPALACAGVLAVSPNRGAAIAAALLSLALGVWAASMAGSALREALAAVEGAQRAAAREEAAMLDPETLARDIGRPGGWQPIAMYLMGPQLAPTLWGPPADADGLVGQKVLLVLAGDCTGVESVPIRASFGPDGGFGAEQVLPCDGTVHVVVAAAPVTLTAPEPRYTQEELNLMGSADVSAVRAVVLAAPVTAGDPSAGAIAGSVGAAFGSPLP